MIHARLFGQLANQCFIVSTTIAHAIRNNTDYSFPSISGRRRQFPFMFPHLPTLENISLTEHREKRFGIYEPIPNNSDMSLVGYFQSFKYFDEYRKEVIEALALPKYPMNMGKVAIHIRRGDSLQFAHKLPQPTEKYLTEAMNQFIGCKFVVFSDDLQFCEEYFVGDEFEFCEEQDAKKAMGMMAACENQIIVNSTYSLFASWLNDNPNKIIVSPSKKSWFSEAYQNRLSAQDLIPDSYIQIDY